MHCRPLEDQRLCSRRKLAFVHANRVDRDQDLVLGIPRVKVRWRMIVGIHGYYDAVESADLGHRSIDYSGGPAGQGMTATDVMDLHSAFAAAGILVWIDGGWAVDALLGRQTRQHDDLDIAVEERHVPALREILARRGYRDVPR